jgi:hypothetical protein
MRLNHSEALSDYVANLQLHMTLQARNLVPSLTIGNCQDSRNKLLQSTQADFERIASRR